MTDQPRPSRLARLASMSDQDFERLCWRLVTLIGILAGAIILFVFIGMIAAGAVLMALEASRQI